MYVFKKYDIEGIRNMYANSLAELWHDICDAYSLDGYMPEIQRGTNKVYALVRFSPLSSGYEEIGEILLLKVQYLKYVKFLGYSNKGDEKYCGVHHLVTMTNVGFIPTHQQFKVAYFNGRPYKIVSHKLKVNR